ncbi:hypothetical protein NMG60_11018365 [Bertholletia excelsa]
MENWFVEGHGTRGEESSHGVPWLPCAAAESSSVQCFGYNPSWPIMAFGEDKEDRAASASKSHSQAEKRRRDRINAQLATLRKLIPKSDKMDKAALLGSVVEQVKDLKRKASEVSKSGTVPTDVDEVTVDCFWNQDMTNGGSSTQTQQLFIKASVCCDDRPELLAELAGALRSLRLTTISADMTCLGGRIKSNLVLLAKEGRDGVCMNSTIQSLRGVLGRIAYSSAGTNYRIKSKRQRFFLPSHCSQ